MDFDTTSLTKVFCVLGLEVSNNYNDSFSNRDFETLSGKVLERLWNDETLIESSNTLYKTLALLLMHHTCPIPKRTFMQSKLLDIAFSSMNQPLNLDSFVLSFTDSNGCHLLLEKMKISYDNALIIKLELSLLIAVRNLELDPALLIVNEHATRSKSQPTDRNGIVNSLQNRHMDHVVSNDSNDFDATVNFLTTSMQIESTDCAEAIISILDLTLLKCLDKTVVSSDAVEKSILLLFSFICKVAGSHFMSINFAFIYESIIKHLVYIKIHKQSNYDMVRFIHSQL